MLLLTCKYLGTVTTIAQSQMVMLSSEATAIIVEYKFKKIALTCLTLYFQQ